jgi:ribosomal protein L28
MTDNELKGQKEALSMNNVSTKNRKTKRSTFHDNVSTKRKNKKKHFP